jgi:hypothetical protein
MTPRLSNQGAYKQEDVVGGACSIDVLDYISKMILGAIGTGGFDYDL